MSLVYCATPARLKRKKNMIMDFVTSLGLGPFHPFQAFQYERFEGGPVGRTKTMEFCCRAIRICNQFWLFGISEGTLTELCYVIKLNRKRKNKIHIMLFLNDFDKKWVSEYARLRKAFGDPLSKIY
jgi:hypothetical protein